MGDGMGKRGRSRWAALNGVPKPAAIMALAMVAGVTIGVHSSSPRTSLSDSLLPYAALVAELDLRRRVNVLHPNPQSIFDGLQVGHVNVGTGNLTFRRRDIVARADGPVVFARVYDSRIEANADLGPGWRLSLAEELRLEGDRAVYTDRSGAEHRFRRDGDAYVAAPPTPRHAGTSLTVAGKKAVLLERDGTKRVFLRAGETAPFLLRRVLSASGRKLLFAHENGLLRSVSHDGATVFEIRRRTDGKVRQVADRHGRSVEYSYTAGGQLKDVYDIAGNLWWHEYDAAGRLTDAFGANRRPYLRVRYDAAGRVARARTGRLHRYAYDGARTTVTEGGGRRHVFEQNALGATNRYTSGSGEWWKIGFDAAGRVKEFDRPGRTLRYRYGTKGEVTAEELWTADGRSGRWFEHDAEGRLTGVETDGADWSQVDYLGDRVVVYGPELDEEFRTANGRVDEVWDGGAFAYAERDAAGDVTALRRAGLAVYFGRDDIGRIVDTTYADGSTSRYFHDALGNRQLVEYGNGASVRYGHDPAGNIVRVEVTETDGTKRTQTTRVGDMNRVERVEYEGSAAIDVAYDDMGRPVRFVSGADTVTVRYDAFGVLAELASEKTDTVWRPPADEGAQAADPRRAVFGGDPLGTAQPEHGVLDFAGGAWAPAPRDLLAAGVPGLAEARALRAAARPLFADDAAARFEKPSNPVFQPPEYRSTNCCIPCLAVVCLDCHIGDDMDVQGQCYCNSDITFIGTGGGGGGDRRSGHVDISTTREKVKVDKDEGQWGVTRIDDPVLGTAVARKGGVWRIRIISASVVIKQGVDMTCREGLPQVTEVTSELIDSASCSTLSTMLGSLQRPAHPCSAGTPYFVEAAVRAHEEQHVDNYLEDASHALDRFQRAIGRLSTPARGTGANTAEERLMAMPAFERARREFYEAHDQSVMDELNHVNPGSFRAAERRVLQPFINDVQARLATCRR